MSLFPDKDILVREIESWKGFADSLRGEDKELFKKMFDECYRFSAAINAKGEPFPTEALLMALIFRQYQIIDWLIKRVQKM